MKREIMLSKLRQETNSLMRERYSKEKQMLQSREPMVAAAFCCRANGSYYLSTSINGESRHRYVRKDEAEYWKKLASAWRAYSEGMAQWVKLSEEIENNLRETGQLRCIPLPPKKTRGKK
jgi:hypothetical protein